MGGWTFSRNLERLTTTWLRLLRDLICIKPRHTKSGATEGIAIGVWIDPTVHEHRHRESEIQKWSAEASVHLWTHHFKGWASELAWGLCFCRRPVQALQDVEDLQSRRAEKHRCKCLKSEPYARSSLFKLAAFLHHKQPEEFPLPSLLINICSEALKLFAQGRFKKGG